MPLETNSPEQPSSLQNIINGVANAPGNIRDGVANMAEQSAELIADKVVENVKIATEKSSEYLAQKVGDLFQTFLAKKKSIDELEKILNDLIADYNVEKSQLTKWAQWVGDMNWFETISYGLLVVVVGAVIGSVYNLAAFFALVSLSIYCLATTVLTEHHTTTTARDGLLINGINSMKESLSKSIDEIGKLAESIITIQVELSKMYKQTEDHLVIAKTQLSDMKGQVDVFMETVAMLTQAKDSLISEITRINQQRDLVNGELCEAKDTLKEQTTRWNNLCNKLEDTNQELLSRYNELIAISGKLKTNNKDVSELTKSIQSGLTLFKSRARPIDTETNSRTSFSCRTPEMRVRSKERIAANDAYVLETKMYLANRMNK